MRMLGIGKPVLREFFDIPAPHIPHPVSSCRDQTRSKTDADRSSPKVGAVLVALGPVHRRDRSKLPARFTIAGIYGEGPIHVEGLDRVDARVSIWFCAASVRRDG
jgi:hypothetical protein